MREEAADEQFHAKEPSGLAWSSSLDQLFHETDRLYYAIARGCGLSQTAYWIMYALEEAHGKASMRELADRWSYSKQTVNSAVKALVSRGLVELAFLEGSKKSKAVCLTDEGRAFSREKVVPGMEAERRAYATLLPSERAELLRLVEKYTHAIDEEIGKALASDDAKADEAASLNLEGE